VKITSGHKFQLISSGNKEQSYMNKELIQQDIIDRKMSLSYQQL